MGPEIHAMHLDRQMVLFGKDDEGCSLCRVPSGLPCLCGEWKALKQRIAFGVCDRPSSSKIEVWSVKLGLGEPLNLCTLCPNHREFRV